MAAPESGGQLLQHPLHHLGLDAQEDVLGLLHRPVIVRRGGTAQLLSQGLGLSGGAVCQHHLIRADGPAGCPGQGPSHIPGSDKRGCLHGDPYFLTVCLILPRLPVPGKGHLSKERLIAFRMARREARLILWLLPTPNTSSPRGFFKWM